MTIRKKDDIKTNIAAELNDNNAGLISAYDLRHNMEDVVDSINSIVGSGDHESAFPFVNNVRASWENGKGIFIADSGVSFPHDPDGPGLQIHHYPGDTGVDHSKLKNLTTGDPHTQYHLSDGSRTMTGNLAMGQHWISASGGAGKGIKFGYHADRDDVHIGSSGDLVFWDNSRFNTGKAASKAWLSFDASSTTPVISGHYNVSSITDRGVGKFRVYFVHDVLGGNNYTAIGQSNARSTAASEEDFERNTVGIVSRSGTYDSQRYLSYQVLNDNSAFVDAARNDLVVFGLGSGVTMGSPGATS